MAPGPVNKAAAICFTVGPKSRWLSSQGADDTHNLTPHLSCPDATWDIWWLGIITDAANLPL